MKVKQIILYKKFSIISDYKTRLLNQEFSKTRLFEAFLFLGIEILSQIRHIITFLHLSSRHLQLVESVHKGSTVSGPKLLPATNVLTLEGSSSNKVAAVLEQLLFQKMCQVCCLYHIFICAQSKVMIWVIHIHQIRIKENNL